MAAAATMRRCVFSLGSNLGDRLAQLESACDYLADIFGGLRLSQVYETEPVGCPEGSPCYLNACVEVETGMPAEEILQLCLRIEAELGRTRSGEYGEARTCDIDLICCGSETCQSATLTLPHPAPPPGARTGICAAPAVRHRPAAHSAGAGPDRCPAACSPASRTCRNTLPALIFLP